MGVTNKRTLTKTRRKTRDVDQVHADLRSPAHLARYQATKAAEDLPGLGRHYCVPCAKWFETEGALGGHKRGKPHRRRLKQLAAEPYTQREAEAAAGLGVRRTDGSEGGPQAKRGVAAASTEAAVAAAEQAKTGEDVAMS